MHRFLICGLVALSLVAAAAAPSTVSEEQVRAAITPLEKLDEAGNARLKAMGPEILPHLARIYKKSSENDRAVVAWIFSSVGWKSSAAKAVLLDDIHTQIEYEKNL